MVRERQNYDGTESWDFTGANIILKTESLTQRSQRWQRKKEVRRSEERDKFGNFQCENSLILAPGGRAHPGAFVPVNSEGLRLAAAMEGAAGGDFRDPQQA